LGVIQNKDRRAGILGLIVALAVVVLFFAKALC
jgi:hypothetical protein